MDQAGIDTFDSEISAVRFELSRTSDRPRAIHLGCGGEQAGPRSQPLLGVAIARSRVDPRDAQIKGTADKTLNGLVTEAPGPVGYPVGSTPLRGA